MLFFIIIVFTYLSVWYLWHFYLFTFVPFREQYTIVLSVGHEMRADWFVFPHLCYIQYRRVVSVAYLLPIRFSASSGVEIFAGQIRNWNLSIQTPAHCSLFLLHPFSLSCATTVMPHNDSPLCARFPSPFHPLSASEGLQPQLLHSSRPGVHSRNVAARVNFPLPVLDVSPSPSCTAQLFSSRLVFAIEPSSIRTKPMPGFRIARKIFVTHKDDPRVLPLLVWHVNLPFY